MAIELLVLHRYAQVRGPRFLMSFAWAASKGATAAAAVWPLKSSRASTESTARKPRCP